MPLKLDVNEDTMSLFRFNVRMSMLALTLKNSTAQLVGFSLLFFVTFIAFASFAFIGEKTVIQLYLHISTVGMISPYLALLQPLGNPWRFTATPSSPSSPCSDISSVSADEEKNNDQFNCLTLNDTGDLDFETMNSRHGGLGTVFYVVYTVIMTFIVMNMFFTILGEGFSSTQIQVRANKYTSCSR